MKKIIKTFVILIIALIIFIGGYYGFKYYQAYQIQQRIKNCVKIVELTKDKIAYNETITLNDLISNINGDKPENINIDTSKLGKQKIKFEYLHTEEQLMVPYEIEIEIVDVTPPTIYFLSSYPYPPSIFYNNFKYLSIVTLIIYWSKAYKVC